MSNNGATFAETPPWPTAAKVYQDGYVSLPGQRLHYVDYGGAGEPVVALHGLIQNAHAFDGIALALVPHKRLLALDLRGRGGSDWGPPDYYNGAIISAICAAFSMRSASPGSR